MAPQLSPRICILVGILITVSTMVCAKTRQFYIGAVEEEWNYAPGDEDETNDHSSQGPSMNQQSRSGTYLRHGPGRIGRRYVKAMYREFTDDSFSQMKPREPWMGLLGPVMGGDEGDILVVVFKNMALLSGRNFSLYSQGLQNAEENEVDSNLGVVSGDSESEELGVAPGQLVSYQWEVTSRVTPATQDDPECLTWAYHSHVDTTRDVNAGLVGLLLTCRPGAMDRLHEQYARQFALLVSVFDENESWYIDHNILTYLNLSFHSAQTLKQDQGFKESNLMRGLNGLMYGHMRGLDVCEGDSTLWHLISLSNNMDFHSVSITGHSFLVNQHRMDAVSLSPGDFVTASLEVQASGQWCLQSNVLGHAEEGMVAYLNVSRCGHVKSRYSSAMDIQRFRRHYIAIEEVDWNYAPSGSNLFEGGDLLQPNSFSEKYFSEGRTRLGGVYRKAQFREYEDVTFSRETMRAEEEEHLGYLGPVLRAEVGDVVGLTLKNNAVNQAFSIYLHGASQIRMWEGEDMSDRDPTEDLLEPGEVRTTYWFLPAAMGPGARDPPCITRLYTSSPSDRLKDAHSGLLGPILICRRGALDRHGQQRQVDREFFLLFSATDENVSWYSDLNFGHLQVDRNSADFYQLNVLHGINGYLYGNLPGLTLCQGDRVTWHLLSVAGSGEPHVHTVSFHGQPLTYLGSHPSTIPLLPGSFATLFMKAENPGDWALVDQTRTHYNAGAKALFHVQQCRLRRNYNVRPSSGKTRTYFLQAEEDIWDYAPSGVNQITGRNLTDLDGESSIYTRNDGQYIGTQYKKARYHQYTNATFSTEIRRPDSEQYLGVLGPVIMAEAFDVITVVFRNMASRNYSIHAQGLSYTKESEGSSYGGRAGGVQPGEVAVYEWSVPLDFAPAEGDPACVSKAYYSAVDPVKDTNSGLVGPLVICKPGTIEPESGERRDVDGSFVLLFKTFDEANSWYLQDNIQQFGSSHAQHDPDFAESNMMHSINGYVHANGPPMEVSQHSTAAWHLMTLGQQQEAGLRSVSWQGNLVHQTPHHEYTGNDLVRLLPGQTLAVWMNATRQGTWTLQGHMIGHMDGTMETARYLVNPPPPQYTTTPNPFGGDVGVN